MGPNKFEQLKQYVLHIEETGDVRKFYEKGNKTAGIRLRKSMQIIKELVQEVRLEISQIKKTRE